MLAKLTLKDVCLTLRDNLTSKFPDTKISNNKEYTHIRILTSKQRMKCPMIDIVNDIMVQSGCNTLTPNPVQQPNRIVAVHENEDFVDLEVWQIQKNEKCIYDIYIYVSPTLAKFEWWYDMYMA